MKNLKVARTLIAVGIYTAIYFLLLMSFLSAEFSGLLFQDFNNLFIQSPLQKHFFFFSGVFYLLM